MSRLDLFSMLAAVLAAVARTDRFCPSLAAISSAHVTPPQLASARSCGWPWI